MFHPKNATLCNIPRLGTCCALTTFTSWQSNAITTLGIICWCKSHMILLLRNLNICYVVAYSRNRLQCPMFWTQWMQKSSRFIFNNSRPSTDQFFNMSLYISIFNIFFVCLTTSSVDNANTSTFLICDVIWGISLHGSYVRHIHMMIQGSPCTS